MGYCSSKKPGGGEKKLKKIGQIKRVVAVNIITYFLRVFHISFS